MGLHNMAGMTTSTTGTGTITLGAALAGLQSFADAGVIDAELVPYSIKDGDDWEIGLGTYTASGTTLARTTIYESSNSDAAIDLSGNAEVRIVLLSNTLLNLIKFNFDETPTTGGQNKDRTSAGTYTAQRAYITIYQPLKLSSIKWDVSSANTYSVKIFLGWQISTIFADLGEQITVGRTAEVEWDAGNLLIMPGKYVLELTWTSAAVIDDNNINCSPTDPKVFQFFEIDRYQYNTTFDINFSSPIKLVAYLGIESLLA